MPPKIPDRWIPYKACGDVIEGTRIICFKVPLHRGLTVLALTSPMPIKCPGYAYQMSGLDPNVQTDPDITEIWDIPAVLAEIPNLGAVIDLTNTARYYNPRDFEQAGVMHRKILMPGREIPSEDKVQVFMDAVDEFLRKDHDSLVGVHCTHGLNRTGYMVCRYMKDRLQIPAEEAIKRFEKARGYEIERQNYLASLLDKELPRPDFEARGQRRYANEIQHRNDGRTRNWHGYQPRYERNGNDGQIRNNDSHSKNKNVSLTKNQKKNLRNRRKKQERRAMSQESQDKPQKRRAKSQESRVKPPKIRKIYNYQ